jgi:cellulose synthase/poly-beta-1,6-N-acetylglucosamine synthase-like glycosyltransferase
MTNAVELLTVIASGGLTILALGLAVLAGYLVVLTLAALLGRRRVPPPGRAERRFAILVPAHDEQVVIGRLLRSVGALDYPRDRYDVCVVADNCTDATADIARAAGARVYERVDQVERAKGFALRWLLARLRAEQRTYDAFVVLDADSVVAPNLLRSMDARLEAGSQVVQVYYSVLNAEASAVAGLRYAALAALHYVRPLGRAALGLSVGLKGNGMCFSAPILEAFAWNWFTLAEDVEFHLALVRHGVRVDFAHETTVLADMPVTLAQAASQNQRWERGRLQLLREHVPGLLRDGVRQRSLLRLDAAIEQLIPPLSVPFLLGGCCLCAALALGAWPAAVLAALGLAAQMAYLATGLLLVRAPLRAYVALSSAPVYIAWKVGVYAHSLLNARASTWVRTARTP